MGNFLVWYSVGYPLNELAGVAWVERGVGIGGGGGGVVEMLGGGLRRREDKGEKSSIGTVQYGTSGVRGP